VIVGLCGYQVLVDDQDAARVLATKWHIQHDSLKRYGRVYFYRSLPQNKTISLHRFILGLGKGEGGIVDHINNNPLDNRKENLRICTNAQNQYNRKRNKNNTSGYRGVRWSSQYKKWRAVIIVNKHNIYLGIFDDPQKAHEVYVRAAHKYYGVFARTE
jgi:hypothetical protein